VRDFSISPFRFFTLIFTGTGSLQWKRLRLFHFIIYTIQELKLKKIVKRPISNKIEHLNSMAI
jgi:hypothetical protein